MRRLVSLLIIAALVALTSAAVRPGYTGKGYVKRATGYSTGGVVELDVNLETLGQDLIAGEYWTPTVDFSAGTKYYFDPTLDPNVDPRGDGSLENPFYGLGYEAEADTVIERVQVEGGSMVNAANNPVVGPGDVCVLLGGDHGDIRFYIWYFSDYVAFVGMPGQTATFDHLRVQRAQHFYFENLTANRNLRTGGAWDWIDPMSGSPAYGDTSVAGYDTGPFFVLVSNDNNGNGDTENFIFKDITCVLAETHESDAWTKDEWNYNFVGGIKIRWGSKVHIQDCNFKSLGNGIRIQGMTTKETHNVNIIGNRLENFCGGAWNFVATDSSCMVDNYSSDIYLVNENHVGHIQGFSDPTVTFGVDECLFSHNTMYSCTDPSRGLDDFLPPLTSPPSYAGKGIGFTTSGGPGPYTNIRIENNVIHNQGFDGDVVNASISVRGGTNVYVVNNTGVGRDNSGNAAISRIEVTDICTDCVVENNITGDISISSGGASTTASNNSEYNRDFTNAGFTSWTLDGNPLNDDYSLRASSLNVNAGLATNAPSTDYLGNYRPCGGDFDIGAYEYQGDCDFVAPAAPLGLSSFSGDSIVELFWDDSPETDAAYHKVYRGTTSGSLSLLHTFATTERDYTDSAVVNGTTYFYAVSVVDDSGNESDLSYEVSETPDVAGLAFDSFSVDSASEAP